MDFAGKLKELRIKSNLSTTELAILVNASQSTISKLENGQRRIDLETLDRICSALGVTLSDFFSDEAPDIPPELRRLLDAAKGLTAEEQQALTVFLKTIKK